MDQSRACSDDRGVMGPCKYTSQIVESNVLLKEVLKRLDKGDDRFKDIQDKSDKRLDEVQAEIGAIRLGMEELRKTDAANHMGYRVISIIAGVVGFGVMAFLTYLGAKK